ncbi:MAG: DUF4244 domain-containing protein [Propionibacteriaceae bacterium]|nr:DUF4244 domain-containing protein [Propionibacteriaceae bacterium]
MSIIKAHLSELVPTCFGWVRPLRRRCERGMATAEYAVGILAAVALALVLLKVFKADGFLTMITQVIGKIFSTILGLF